MNFHQVDEWLRKHKLMMNLYTGCRINHTPWGQLWALDGHGYDGRVWSGHGKNTAEVILLIWDQWKKDTT